MTIIILFDQIVPSLASRSLFNQVLVSFDTNYTSLNASWLSDLKDGPNVVCSFSA